MAFEIFVQLSPSLIKPVKRWVKNFKRHEPYWVTYPELRGSCLQLSAPSFPFLMAYADVTDSNELDLRRLRKNGKQAMEARLVQSLDSREVRALERALENLEILHDGEFLNSPIPLSEVFEEGETLP